MSRSIMQDPDSRECYLCALLDQDRSQKDVLQKHHAMHGTANRKLAEHYGLHVKLCMQHHTIGQTAVHNNAALDDLLKKEAQRAFEKRYGHEKWMQTFGKNYL